MNVKFQGSIADGREIEDSGRGVGIPDSGPHAGHKVSIVTDKHNCGAYQKDVRCSLIPICCCPGSSQTRDLRELSLIS